MSRRITSISLEVSTLYLQTLLFVFWRLITKICVISPLVDDSTGVMTCVLWLNDYGNHGGQSGKRQSEIRMWLSTNNVSIGDTLAVLGGLEYYQDKIQINVHKLRLIRDVGEEMLQY